MQKPATTFNEILGQVVSRRRKDRDTSQAEIAAELTVTQSAYSRLERGRSSFSVPQLRRAARALGLDVSLLFMEAELGAQRLAKDGVHVLDEPRASVGEGAHLWVASSRIEVAIDTAVKQSKQASYIVKAGTKKQAQQTYTSWK